MWINLFILTTGLHVFHHTHHDHTWFGKECKRYQMSSARLLIGGSHTHTHTHTLSASKCWSFLAGCAAGVFLITPLLTVHRINHQILDSVFSLWSGSRGEVVGGREAAADSWNSPAVCLAVCCCCCCWGQFAVFLTQAGNTANCSCFSESEKRERKKKITYSLELWQHCFTHRSSPVLVHLQS